MPLDIETLKSPELMKHFVHFGMRLMERYSLPILFEEYVELHHQLPKKSRKEGVNHRISILEFKGVDIVVTKTRKVITTALPFTKSVLYKIEQPNEIPMDKNLKPEIDHTLKKYVGREAPPKKKKAFEESKEQIEKAIKQNKDRIK